MTARDITLLDGGMGLELRKRGIIRSKAVWAASALHDAPEDVVAVHEDFINAGAQIITTNNYGANPFALAQTGMADRLEDLVDTAVDLARKARDNSGKDVVIAGCMPPLHQSYRPDLVGTEMEMELPYALIAEHLVGGIDFFLCETMSSALEAKTAARAALRAGSSGNIPVWVSWTLGDDGRLRSGESIREALNALDGIPIEAFLFNCCQPEAVTRAMPELRSLTTRKVGAYANALQLIPNNSEQGDHPPHAVRNDLNIRAYLAEVEKWIDAGADIIGGCCGIGPEYIQAMGAFKQRL